MNRSDVQKKKKRQNILTGFIIGLASNIIIYFVVNGINYFYKLEPLLEGMNTEIQTLCKKETEAGDILRQLESPMGQL